MRELFGDREMQPGIGLSSGRTCVIDRAQIVAKNRQLSSGQQTESPRDPFQWARLKDDAGAKGKNDF